MSKQVLFIIDRSGSMNGGKLEISNGAGDVVERIGNAFSSQDVYV